MRRDGDFLLSMDKNAEVVIRDRGDKVDFPTLHRKHDLIPSGEITAQIQYVVKASMGIKREDLPKSVLQGFGWSTVNDGARDRIDAHVEELIQSGAIVESEGYLIEGQLH